MHIVIQNINYMYIIPHVYDTHIRDMCKLMIRLQIFVRLYVPLAINYAEKYLHRKC